MLSKTYDSIKPFVLKVKNQLEVIYCTFSETLLPCKFIIRLRQTVVSEANLFVPCCMRCLERKLAWLKVDQIIDNHLKHKQGLKNRHTVYHMVLL